ncbi:MAG TPA: DUF6159 family protein [Verrucomicrobiae bacterium]|jgi:hypothetical protein|nr:DUF6159 family protein [Verrucomicrobiae bacterium]
MGTLSRTWDLMGQSFRVLKSDKELMWLPVLSAIFCLMATVIIGGSGFLLMGPTGPIPQDVASQKLFEQQMAPWIFLLYVVNYSLSVYFNVALVGIALNRLSGGNATLSDGLQLAWDRKWSILQWALLSATIGMLLQAIERRVGFLGRLVAGFIGVMWTLASFFVVPVLAVQGVGPVEALSKSGHIFRQRWGEQVAGGFSFQLLFFLLALPGALPPLMGVQRFGLSGLLVGFTISVIYWVLLAVVGSAARGIFVAALYRYATDQSVPPGFDRGDLAGAFQAKGR